VFDDAAMLVHSESSHGFSKMVIWSDSNLASARVEFSDGGLS
jgi:hypothetical protein